MSRTHYPKSEFQAPQAVQAQGALLPRDPNKAIGEIIQVIGNLHDVYERETQALEASNTKAFMAVQDEKLEAARKYQLSIGEFMKRRTEMKAADPQVNIKLQVLQEKFRDLTLKNKTALEQMQRSVERLGNTLRGIAKEAVQKDRVFSYGENGQIDVDKARPVSTGIIETA